MQKAMKKSTVTMNELVTSKMANLMAANKINTANNYRSLLHFLERNFGVVYCSDCTPGFVQKMDAAMAGLSPSTKATYFATFRAIWNYANYKGYTGKADYPFRTKSYEIDKVKVPKILRRSEWYASREEMSEIYRYWEGMDDCIRKRYIGLFLASYLCNGANLNDVVRLQYNNDWFSSGGTILSFVRKKTEERAPVKVRVPVTGWLRKILDYMADEPVRNGYVFGSFIRGWEHSEKAMQKRVMTLNNSASKILKKELGKAGMRNDLSVTFARHSFSSALHHLGAPFALVEQAMGHSGGGVAFNYIASFSDKDLFKWSELLIV